MLNENGVISQHQFYTTRRTCLHINMKGISNIYNVFSLFYLVPNKRNADI